MINKTRKGNKKMIDNFTIPKPKWIYNDKPQQIPEQYIKDTLRRGSCYIQGKYRIYDIIKGNDAETDKIKYIKKEYGLGGGGYTPKGTGISGYDTLHNKLKIEWVDKVDEEGYLHKEFGYLTWKEVFNHIKALIDSNDYFTQEEQEEKTSLDVLKRMRMIKMQRAS